MSGKMVLNGIEYVGNGGGSGGGNVDDVKVNGVSVVDSNKEAQIKSYKEITQAEWEALPSTKLTDGIAYFITDSAGANQFPPLIYSDEEREIGVWRDGKPLYQKTFWLSSRTYVTSNYTTILINDITDYNIDNIIEGIGYDNNDGSLALDVVHMIDGTLSFLISNSNKLIVQSPNNNAYCICGFTLKYTKTTDIPGSGKWTTQGTVAHHYSTDEHIVGTWIDGKPLYECCYVYENTSGISSGDTTIWSIGNDKFFIPGGLIGIFKNIDGDKNQYPLPWDGNGSRDNALCYLQTSGNIILRVKNDSWNNNYRYLYIIARYTKTTD